ncbi:conjugal transfer protein TraD [Paraburkholderia strydomiana]|uniref:conjugal transfer protein TraD n=1 Tax=Paraburkholderia strydomiana TaxID=1245417 RepID=UPI0038B87C12
MRQQDTRHKIELGGLVVKAGLGDLDKAVILGILLDAKQRMTGKTANAEFERFSLIGSEAFKSAKDTD